jgi:hypothetical protein
MTSELNRQYMFNISQLSLMALAALKAENRTALLQQLLNR